MSNQEKNCPYCAEKIKNEAIKCRFCGEWLQDTRENGNNETPEHESRDSSLAMKTVFGIISFTVFSFAGLLLGGWVGLIIGIVLWLIAAGSIGLTKDISDAGEAARQNKMKR